MNRFNQLLAVVFAVAACKSAADLPMIRPRPNTLCKRQFQSAVPGDGIMPRLIPTRSGFTLPARHTRRLWIPQPAKWSLISLINKDRTARRSSPPPRAAASLPMAEQRTSSCSISKPAMCWGKFRLPKMRMELSMIPDRIACWLGAAIRGSSSLSIPKPISKTAKADSVDLGGKPEFLAADGAGKAFVNLNDKNQIVVVDLKSLSVTDHWAIGSGTLLPHGAGDRSRSSPALCRLPQSKAGGDEHDRRPRDGRTPDWCWQRRMQIRSRHE